MLGISLAPLCVPLSHVPRHSVSLLATSNTTDGKEAAIADVVAPYKALAKYITENAKPAKLLNTSLLKKNKKSFELFMYTKSCQTDQPGTPAKTAGQYKSVRLGKFNNKLSSDCMGPMYCPSNDLNFYVTFGDSWTNEMQWSLDNTCDMLCDSGSAFKGHGSCEAAMCPTGYDYSLILKDWVGRGLRGDRGKKGDRGRGERGKKDTPPKEEQAAAAAAKSERGEAIQKAGVGADKLCPGHPHILLKSKSCPTSN
jgi:hypothetical protein